MPVFEVLVIEHPSIEDSKAGALERLISGPTCVVAKDSKSAALIFILGLKDTLKADPSRIEIRTRPFV